jgi:hypothetical protein
MSRAEVQRVIGTMVQTYGGAIQRRIGKVAQRRISAEAQ